MNESGAKPLVVDDLSVHFRVRRLFTHREIRAVEHLDLELHPGETLALVGESGSGKTTVGRAILRLVKPAGGSVRYGEIDVLAARGSRLKALRSEIQVVFQDPYHSLNPSLNVGQMLGEALKVHFKEMGRTARRDRSIELLEQVGLASYHLERRPAEFSGGQRQRLAIARALVMEPNLIICDEPVSALDVSTQSQVINLLESLQQRLGLSYLFISHDLAVVRHTSHRIAVMYRGRLVEIGPAERVYSAPGHPYTKNLLAAVPFPDPERQAAQRVERQKLRISAAEWSQRNVSAGCRYAPRCTFAMERCWNEVPPMYDVPGGGSAACFLAERQSTSARIEENGVGPKQLAAVPQDEPDL